MLLRIGTLAPWALVNLNRSTSAIPMIWRQLTNYHVTTHFVAPVTQNDHSAPIQAAIVGAQDESAEFFAERWG